MLHFDFSTRGFWTTFDQLAVTVRPRRAVASFMFLATMATVLVVGGGFSVGAWLSEMGIELKSALSIDSSGRLETPNLSGLLFSFAIGSIWYSAITFIRTVSLQIGNDGKGDMS
jgi:hypothetical protein